MVAVEDWKNQLYEKTQIAVKYSPAKYKPDTHYILFFLYLKFDFVDKGV